MLFKCNETRTTSALTLLHEVCLNFKDAAGGGGWFNSPPFSLFLLLPKQRQYLPDIYLLGCLALLKNVYKI